MNKLQFAFVAVAVVLLCAVAYVASDKYFDNQVRLAQARDAEVIANNIKAAQAKQSEAKALQDALTERERLSKECEKGAQAYAKLTTAQRFGLAAPTCKPAGVTAVVR